MKLLGFLERDAIKTELEATTKDEAIRELVAVLVKSGLCDPKHEDDRHHEHPDHGEQRVLGKAEQATHPGGRR